MSEDKAAHRKIIRAIHNRWLDGTAFSPNEVLQESGCSQSSILRALRYLQHIRNVSKQAKGFRGRRYRVTANWPPDVENAIEAFEQAKAMGI